MMHFEQALHYQINPKQFMWYVFCVRFVLQTSVLRYQIQVMRWEYQKFNVI